MKAWQELNAVCIRAACAPSQLKLNMVCKVSCESNLLFVIAPQDVCQAVNRTLLSFKVVIVQNTLECIPMYMFLDLRHGSNLAQYQLRCVCVELG